MDLSPGEQETLNQFQVISSFPEDKYDQVVQLLRDNYWNLETALSKYFDGALDEPIVPNEPQSAVPMSSEQPMTPHGVLLNDDLQQLQQLLNGSNGMLLPQLPIIRPISNKWRTVGIQHDPLGWQQLSQSPLLFIILLIPRGLTLLFTGVTWLFNLLFPSLDAIPSRPTTQGFRSAEWYRDIVRDECPYEFYKGDFNMAFEEAKRDSQFFLLIVVGSNDKSTNFAKKVLHNDAMSQFLKDDGCVVYVAHAEDTQGHEIATSFKTRALPSVYLMGDVTSGLSSVSSMSLISRIPTKSLSSMMNKLKFEMEKFKPELITKKMEMEELRYSRELRQLQDRAYEESLIADQIKQSKKEEEKRVKQQEEEEAQRRELQRLTWFKSTHHKFQQPTEYQKGDHTTIRIRLPNGEQIIQKFNRDQTLVDIYAFVSLKLYLQDHSLDEFDAVDEVDIDEYIHNHGFELISPMPRCTLPVDMSLLQTVDQIWPNGSLLVEFDEPV